MTSTLVEGEWPTSRPGRFTPEESVPGSHWIGAWVDLRADLDDLEQRKFFTLPGFELRLLDHPARRWSLYRLRYPGWIISENNWILKASESHYHLEKIIEK
jgi:hypothetical protein